MGGESSKPLGGGCQREGHPKTLHSSCNMLSQKPQHLSSEYPPWNQLLQTEIPFPSKQAPPGGSHAYFLDARNLSPCRCQGQGPHTYMSVSHCCAGSFQRCMGEIHLLTMKNKVLILGGDSPFTLLVQKGRHVRVPEFHSDRRLCLSLVPLRRTIAGGRSACESSGRRRMSRKRPR